MHTMLVQSEFQKDVSVERWVALFCAVASIGEAICSIVGENRSTAVDLTLYLVFIMLFFIYAGYQAMRSVIAMPNLSCVGMIGVLFTLIPVVLLTFAQTNHVATPYVIALFMPIAYGFSYQFGREFYVASVSCKKK